MSTADDVRRLLSRAPGEPLCDACLALACASSLDDMCAVTETLAKPTQRSTVALDAVAAGAPFRQSSTASAVRVAVSVRPQARDRAEGFTGRMLAAGDRHRGLGGAGLGGPGRRGGRAGFGTGGAGAVLRRAQPSAFCREARPFIDVMRTVSRC
jgi:hypothetical protein